MEVHIDLTYLDNMTGGDNELKKEMIQIFKEQVPEFVSDMRKYHQNNDLKNLAAVTHKAKSTISIIGLVQLINDLKEFEKDVANNVNYESYGRFIDIFETTCNQAITQLDSI